MDVSKSGEAIIESKRTSSSRNFAPTAVIVAWNHADESIECLKSFRECSNCPVVVVDNGSTQENVDKLAQWFEKMNCL